MDDIAARLAAVDARIAEAMRASGRADDTVTRIVVTKFHPVETVERLLELGVRDFGENRQQELSAKSAQVSGSGARWHFVGQAQTKKARAIRAVASVVHSVDRIKLADALERAGVGEDGVLDVLLQINLTDDLGRGGVAPEELEQLAEHAAGCHSLRVRGVMAVAPLGEPARPAFERLAGYAERLRTVVPDADWISAGMTADFAEAIAVGATHLRIGSAITGPRPVRN